MKRIAPRIAPLCAVVAAVLGLTLATHAQDDPAAADGAAQTQPAEEQATQAAPAPGSAAAPGTATAEPSADDAAPAADAPADGKPDAERELTEISYAIGYMVGREYHRNGVELEPGVFAEGLRAGLTGGEPRVSLEELQATLTAFGRKMEMQQLRQAQEQVSQGQAFLDENKAKEGVTVTESGLQYQVLEQGEGASPGPQDTVRVHYRGTLIDGAEFDSSYARGEPATFRVNEVIPGWSEALQLMQPGGKYRLVVPAELAYGERGRPGIPPNAVLVFEVELLDVMPQ